MNPPTQGGHLLNGAGLQNITLQQHQIQQLLQAGLSTQQLAQLLSIQQQQPPQQPQLNGFGGPSITTSISNQHHQTAPQFVIPSHAPAPVPQHQPVPQSQPSQAPSLPWPTCTAFPLTRVPYFDVNTYKVGPSSEVLSKSSLQSVNLDVSPSCDPNGLDLPLGDMNTLRFFFNLGVQQSKVLMLASKNNQHSMNAEVQLNHVQQQPQSVNVMEQLNMNNSHLLRQMAAQQQAAAQQAAAQQAQQAAAQQAAAQQAAQAQAQQHASQTPVMQSLAHQQQQLAQQNQLLLATARAHGLTERHLAQFGIQTPEIVQLAQSQQVQQATAPMSMPSTIPVSTVTSSMPRVSSTTREFPSAKNSVGSDQAPDPSALMLHHALLSISNNKTNMTASSLHEARIQQLLGQQVHTQPIPIHQAVDPMLKAAAAVAEVLKPVAVGGGSGDAAVSPRPPIPVDPSPPKALIEATRHQQAQTSPPTSHQTTAPEILLKVKPEPIIGAIRPGSAREGTIQSTTNGTGKASAPPNINPDETPTHLFHVSEKHFTEAFTKGVTNNPIGIALRPDSNQPGASNDDGSRSSADIKREDDENKPALAPILMMSFLNSCMSTMKNTLNTSGVPVSLDNNGQPVDFSSRPVDKIFQQARQQQAHNNIREMSPMKRKTSPTTTQPEIITVPDSSSPGDKETSPIVKVDLDDRSDSGSEGGGKRLRIATDEE